MEKTMFKKGDSVVLNKRIKHTDPLVGSILVITAFLVDNKSCEVEDDKMRYYVELEQIQLLSAFEHSNKQELIERGWIEVELEDGLSLIRRSSIQALKQVDSGTYIFVADKIIVSNMSYSEIIKML